MRDQFHRKTFCITPEHDRWLGKESKRRGIGEADIIRRMIDAAMAAQKTTKTTRAA